MGYRTSRLASLTWHRSGDGLDLRPTAPDGSPVDCDPETAARLFAYATEERKPAELRSVVAGETDWDGDPAALVATLLDAGVLVEPSDRRKAGQSLWFDRNWRWSLYFHRATRTDGPDAPAPDRPVVGADADPPANRVELPSPRDLPSVPVSRLLLSRRTRRNFDGEHLSAGTLSSLLAAAFAPTAGDRTPLVAYVVPARCEGTGPGPYRYHPGSHTLSEAGTTPLPDDAGRVDEVLRGLAVDQPYMTGGAVTFLLGVDLSAYRDHYPLSRGFRETSVRTSTFVHRLLLGAAALDHDAFLTAALDDDAVADLLDVDPLNLAIQCLVTVGAATGESDHEKDVDWSQT